MSNDKNHGGCHKNPGWMLPAGIGFALLGGYYLWAQHRAHVLQYWPLAFFLLCPLMHLFGDHGKHGGHGASSGNEGSDRSNGNDAKKRGI
jgi:hypothetical protein